MKPEDKLYFAGLSDAELLAHVMWGEARGEGDDGMRAVGCVVLNRWRDGRYGRSIADVVLRPYQFSCFNDNDPNLPKLRKLRESKDPAYEQALKIAHDLMRCAVEDKTGNATHYHVSGINPSWAYSTKMVRTAKIGRHVFYREVPSA